MACWTKTFLLNIDKYICDLFCDIITKIRIWQIMNYWLLMVCCYILLYNAPILVSASVAGILEICIVVFNLCDEVVDAVNCQLMQHLVYTA